MPTRRAVSLIRTEPHYRHDAFLAGLKAAGFEVKAQVTDPRAGDVLVIWNRYGHTHEMATRWERAGAQVVVAENGYFGNQPKVRRYYALALHGHQGSGAWVVDGAARWEHFGVPLAPWRTEGKHILVVGQRGIGSPKMASPAGWAEDCRRRLTYKHTQRPVRLRQHPGNHLPATPIEADLQDAWAVVVWSSACAVNALIAGIPVFYEAPHIVVQKACQRDIAKIETPEFPDRLPALIDMAHAQWTVDEIASGAPFRRLLSA